VAQPGRAPGSGPGGRRFKSSLPDQYFQVDKQHFWFFVYIAVVDFVDGEILTGATISRPVNVPSRPTDLISEKGHGRERPAYALVPRKFVGWKAEAYFYSLFVIFLLVPGDSHVD
jgi:hypothetical protein